MSGPCSDIRVIDLSSGQVGGVSTMVLADFGADVVKVEPPGGDPARDLPAAPMWLRGKRSLVLDLGHASDRDRLHDLVRGADVVVSSYAPGEAAAHAADYETLAAINPGLVYCSITGWGPKGPYAHYPAEEPVVAAKTGRMLVFQTIAERGGPAYQAVPVASHAASQSALSGILAALLARDGTGRGQLVETSLLQGLFPYDLNGLVRAQLGRYYPEHFPGDPNAPIPLGKNALQYIPAMASDGRWIQFANLMDHHFHAMMAAAGLTELYSDPRFTGAPDIDLDAVTDLRGHILEALRQRPAEEWMTRFREMGSVAAEVFAAAQEALYHPDLLANGEVVQTEHPRLGSVRQLGPLARLTATPGQPAASDPLVGQDSSTVLREPPRPAWQPAATAGTPPKHPLEGITIIEFATIIAAPLGASFLADLGARVIRVEPTTGDPYRSMGAGGLGRYIGSCKTTAGKESICVDLKSEAGREIARQLIAQADMVVHNYRPGVPERLGIGYDEVRQLRPDIIYLSSNGYGPDGPSAHRPAAHPIPGAAVGGALLQAGSGMPPSGGTLNELLEASRWLYRANEANPDPNTSVVLTSAAMLALYARSRTGKGQQVFLSMMGANAYANLDDFISYEGKAPRRELDPGLYGLSSLHRLYRARDGWVFVSAETPERWEAFCKHVTWPDLANDPLFRTPESRRDNDMALSAALCAVFVSRGADEWEALLIPAGVACVRADATSIGEWFADDPQMAANGFDTTADHPIWGRYQRWGPTVTLSDTPGTYGPGVLAGQTTDALLAELGYSDADIRSLHDQRIVATIEPMQVDPTQGR